MPSNDLGDRYFLATIIFALHTEGDRSLVSVDFTVVGEAIADNLPNNRYKTSLLWIKTFKKTSQTQ